MKLVKNMEKNKQIEWINILRGFAIFLIVFGHAIGYSKGLTKLSRYLSSFYVPLFFLIAGYLFHENKEEKVSTFIKRKAKRILIPYFVFGMLSLIPYFLFGGEVQETLNSKNSISSNIIGSICTTLYGSGHGNRLSQNSPLWFLPCYFIVVVIAKIVYDKTKTFKYKSAILSVFFLTVGGILYKYFNIAYPFGFETALVMLYFYFIGHCLQKINMGSNKTRAIVGVTTLVIGFIIHLFNGRISCMNNNYKNSYLIFILSATFTSIGYTYLFSLIKKCRVLSYLGKHTIPILVVHKMPLVIFQSKLGIISTYLKQGNLFYQISLSLVMAIASIIVSILIYKVISRFLPIMYGEEKHNT